MTTLEQIIVLIVIFHIYKAVEETEPELFEYWQSINEHAAPGVFIIFECAIG